MANKPWRYIGMIALASLSISVSARPTWATPMVQHANADPLKGEDLYKLEAEKQHLMSLHKEPGTAMILSVIPGVGHMYADMPGRGVWVLGGFAGTLVLSFISSYLLSTLNTDTARTFAIIVNVAPTTAYITWSATDAYYQTTLQNKMYDQRIKEITTKQNEYGFYSTLWQISF